MSGVKPLSTPAKHMTFANANEAKRKIEKTKPQLCTKVAHPFPVINRQFGSVKTRFRSLTKDKAQLLILFALPNCWMACMH